MEPETPLRQQTTSAVSYDAGLRAHMQSIYNRMSVGVFVTGLTSWIVASSPALLELFLGGPQRYIVIFAPLAIVWFGFNPMRMNSSQLRASFLALSALYGVSFSSLFFLFAQADIARAFFISAGMFAGLSLYGYTTRKNLDGLGAFAVMGIWGALILSLLTIFVHSSALMNFVSVISIIAFAGLTAWQTQAMKEMYHPANGDEANSRMAWGAALTLYISFIALFQRILYLVGSNRR
jgi:FtsH-binding integral membrane protein